jgi:class 3 adenylate cyclase
MGEESLSGPEVNFIFRMEKLAASLQRRCLMSAASREILGTHLPAEPEGEHAVAGFVGTFEFFAF